MAQIRELIRALDELLDPGAFDDLGPNGLQVPGAQEVRRLAIVSGGAASRLDQAIAEGYDAFLTGEPKENVMADAREAGIHFIAAGHYATETFGVRRLGDWLADRFDVEHVWGDIPKPV